MRHHETHDFTPRLGDGKFGEKIAILAMQSLPDWSVNTQPRGIGEQKDLGIDYVGTFNRDRGTIEIKTDMAAIDSGKIAFETHHEHDKGGSTEGWMATSTATFLVVLVTPRADLEAVREGSTRARTGTMLVFSLRDLRKEFDGWRQMHPAKKARNRSYWTWFVPVPIPFVRKWSRSLLVSYGVTYSRNDSGFLEAGAKLWPRQTTFGDDRVGA